MGIMKSMAIMQRGREWACDECRTDIGSVSDVGEHNRDEDRSGEKRERDSPVRKSDSKNGSCLR